MMIKLDEMKLTSQQAMWVVFSRGKIVIQESSESIPVAYLSEIPFLASYIDDIHQLPPLNETAQRDMPVFVVDLGAEHIEEPGWERVSLRQLLFADYENAFSVIGRAWQYIHFLRTHQFCGQCGAKTERVDWEMAMHCHRCQHRSYPRVSPCIIVSIHNNEKILLAKGVRHRESNMY